MLSAGQPDGASPRVRQPGGEGGQELPHHGRQLLHLQGGWQVGDSFSTSREGGRWVTASPPPGRGAGGGDYALFKWTAAGSVGSLKSATF